MSTDPLLKAIAHGDPRCPDGERLARLGALTRGATKVAHGDIRDRVRQALSAEHSATGSDLEADIDQLVDGQPSDPTLERLQHLVRGIQPPQRSDLRERVRRALAGGSLRLTPQQAVETGRRWRLITAVAAAHVAAILLFTTLSNHDNGVGPDTFAGQREYTTQTTTTATSWEHLRATNDDLLAPRRDEVQRELARNRAGLGGTAPAVSRMVAWLIAHQDPVSGRIGDDSPGERGIAIQALAALALFGEGGGDQTRLVRAKLALGPVAAAMAGAEPLGPQTLAAAALALVDGALVSRDPELRLQAQAGLLRLTRELPGKPGEGGLAGFAWLALEAAETAGIPTPDGALDAARHRIAHPVPSSDDGVGRIGLATYARIVLGQRTSADACAGLARLATQPPAITTERIDLLSWCLAGLAVHEGGGAAWNHWAAGLARTIPSNLVSEGAGLSRMPAALVRYCDGRNGDTLATAAAIIALQTPYRYLLLSRE